IIGLCRAKMMVVQLRPEKSTSAGGDDEGHAVHQRGLKGNIIVYPQKPTALLRCLPPSMDEIIAPICVLFIGSTKPSDDWLRRHVKPLAVDGHRIRRALVWLKANNSLYEGIEFNELVLTEFEKRPWLPVPIQHVVPSSAGETLTSRYDSSAAPPDSSPDVPDDASIDIPMSNVFITDLDMTDTSRNLRLGALCHVKERDGHYTVELPHDREPANEFFDQTLFPKVYPTLFPYGIGGLDDKTRSTPISLKSHVKH
ncbi:hypothetical protein BDZ89DRAFT_900060, partial [Hymenopellis radicata]